MGHRTAKRVPLDFDWPLKEVWSGYLNPLDFPQCEACGGSGNSPEYNHYHDLWYGHAPFRPEDNGSMPFGPEHPEVVAFAQRNVAHAAWFYGHGDEAVRREAVRLSSMWDTEWCHHLNQADVDALVSESRLWDLTREFIPGSGWRDRIPATTPTAAEVNAWSLRSMGHDAINSWVVIKARCEREGLPVKCAACDGNGYPPEAQEAYDRYDNWQPTEPPVGEGWQLWETTSEGSPVSPVFATAEELADWCEPSATWFASEHMSRDEWLRGFLNDTTDVDTLLVMSSPLLKTSEVQQ